MRGSISYVGGLASCRSLHWSYSPTWHCHDATGHLQSGGASHYSMPQDDLRRQMNCDFHRYFAWGRCGSPTHWEVSVCGWPTAAGHWMAWLTPPWTAWPSWRLQCCLLVDSQSMPLGFRSDMVPEALMQRHPELTSKPIGLTVVLHWGVQGSCRPVERSACLLPVCSQAW